MKIQELKRSCLFFLGIIFFISCESKSKMHHLQGEAFGSTYSIKYYGKKDYKNEIIKILQEFDDAVSTYKENSDVMTFNHSEKGTNPNGMFPEVWEISKEIHKKTQGYFDPSVEPLIRLWGFGKDGIKHYPTDSQVDSVKFFTGLNKTYSNSEFKIYKEDSRIKLNFNAITGYVNDKIGEFFKSENINNFLIEIGGEILSGGKKEDESDWIIGLDNPLKPDEREILVKFKLNDMAFAPSGNYRKYYVDDSGKKIVHIINPITGYPETSAILSASIIAKTCAEADAVATAIIAMGLDKAEDFFKSNHDIKGFLIISISEDETQTKTYNGIEEFIVK